MILLYQTLPIYVGEFNYRLGSFKWDLATLKAKGLLSGDIKPLWNSAIATASGWVNTRLCWASPGSSSAHLEQRCAARGRGTSFSGGKRRFAA